jgi:hypothetical protein
MEENGYLKWGFFQGILLFVINCSGPFMKMLDEFFFIYCILMMIMRILKLYILLLKLYMHILTISLISMKKIPSGPCDDHDQVDELHEAKADISPHVLAPTSSKTQHRYTPLKLPQVLHNFPPKYYEYLLVFDGELDGISAEKHIQGFEHFVDLFEIDHDDVYMRVFSQSLKGNTKDWFKHLYPKTISSWEELKNVFFKF